MEEIKAVIFLFLLCARVHNALGRNECTVSVKRLCLLTVAVFVVVRQALLRGKTRQAKGSVYLNRISVKENEVQPVVLEIRKVENKLKFRNVTS